MWTIIMCYFLKCIKIAVTILCHGWNVRYGNKTKSRNKSSNAKKIFQPWFSNVLRVSTHLLMTSCHVISKNLWFWRVYHRASHTDEEKHSSTGCHLRPVKRSFSLFGGHQVTQVGEFPSSYSYLIILRLVFYSVVLLLYKYNVQCVRCTLVQASLRFVTWNVRFLLNHHCMVRNHNYRKTGIHRIANKCI